MDGQLSWCVQFSSSSCSVSSPSPASPASSAACQRSFFFNFLVFSDFLLVKMRIERVYFGIRFRRGGPHMISFHNFMPRNVCSMSGIMLELC